jgi:phosphate/sulfate permease
MWQCGIAGRSSVQKEIIAASMRHTVETSLAERPELMCCLPAWPERGRQTVRDCRWPPSATMLMAWVLTLPAAICLSAGLYVLFSHPF